MSIVVFILLAILTWTASSIKRRARAAAAVAPGSPEQTPPAKVPLDAPDGALDMTNVAGPRERLFLAGVPIDRMMFWMPHPGRQLGMGVSILSYAGAATVAVIADAHLVPDPETITRRFTREFARMLAASRAR
jgi:HAMP domain-containing protein